MKPRFIIFLTKLTAVLIFCCNFSTATAQDSVFWHNVHYGGSVGLGFGSGYADVNLSPGAVYRFNRYVAAGVSLQGSYTYQKNYYSTLLYGASPIVLFNPIPQIQLSAELQELRVNQKFDQQYLNNLTGPAIPAYAPLNTRDFWNTALFLGAGYQNGNATIGLRYNVLYHTNDQIYYSALMPFVRFYF